jgi:glycosyltransferase involved in cell wall biosynthesis
MAARRLNPWATRAADAVTCDSIDQARLIRSWGVPADRVSVIGWGVDRDHFHPGVSGSAMRARLGIPPAAPVVLSPRQWYSNSNIPAVIASHARLPEDTHLLLKRIPGYEPDGGAAVFNAIDSSPARERIHVLGAIPPDELPAMYGAADVVVSLCTTDGTSVSVLEAMAVGRPVVALYNPSLAEWISEPGGRLVQSLEPDAVAQALVELLAPSAQERASDHNRDVIASRADRALEFSRMDELYGRLVGTASPAGAPRS